MKTSKKFSSKLSKKYKENKKKGLIQERYGGVFRWSGCELVEANLLTVQVTTVRSTKRDDGFVQDPRSHSWFQAQTHCFLEH